MNLETIEVKKKQVKERNRTNFHTNILCFELTNYRIQSIHIVNTKHAMNRHTHTHIQTVNKYIKCFQRKHFHKRPNVSEFRN